MIKKTLLNKLQGIAKYIGGITVLFFQSIRWALTPPYELSLLFSQMQFIGVESTTIVMMTAFATGSILALQTSFELTKLGAKIYVGKVVALSFVRELGPVLSSIVVSGRVGSGIAAEIGSMNVTEQVDAIRALGANPIKKLVVPRLFAAMIMLPALALLGNIIGMFGGLMIAIIELRLNPTFFLMTMIQSITFEDLFLGLFKSFIFGIIIAIIACYEGLKTTGGTAGVGKATTETVVISSIAILIIDVIITKIFMIQF